MRNGAGVRAVILAGGKGTRLAPYTTILPKPLMPVGDMPILELLIRQLHRAGIDRITLAVGHLSSLIMAYFQDGQAFDVSIDYSFEDEPLGTAGPLTLIDGLDERFLVMNGDLLTDIDFRGMIAAHVAGGALATVGIYERSVRIDLGVVEISADRHILRYVEKPTNRFMVSMGVYVFEPDILNRIPRGRPFDLPALIESMLGTNDTVVAFPHDGYWLDIGRPDDYLRAQDDVEEIRARILGTQSSGVSPTGAA